MANDVEKNVGNEEKTLSVSCLPIEVLKLI